MADIVERLRKLADRERPYGSLPDTLDEAAAEIERLRAALEEIVGLGAICASDIAAITLRKSRARAALEGA